MAWEKRHNKTYYYCKIRRGDRFISHYLGTGPAVDQFLHDQQQRRQAEQQQRQALKALDANLDHLYTLIQALHHTTLLLAGYHTHKGQWRKKRRRSLTED